jgi:hypothetical protein
MTGCSHRNCGDSEKVWLMHTYKGKECGLKPHPYCVECGLVKNLSSEKPRKIGFYINIVAALGERLKISQAQMRLVSKELQDSGLEDSYGMDRYQQEVLFTRIVRKYVRVSEHIIHELF